MIHPRRSAARRSRTWWSRPRWPSFNGWGRPSLGQCGRQDQRHEIAREHRRRRSPRVADLLRGGRQQIRWMRPRQYEQAADGLERQQDLALVSADDRAHPADHVSTMYTGWMAWIAHDDQLVSPRIRLDEDDQGRATSAVKITTSGHTAATRAPDAPRPSSSGPGRGRSGEDRQDAEQEARPAPVLVEPGQVLVRGRVRRRWFAHRAMLVDRSRGLIGSAT